MLEKYEPKTTSQILGNGKQISEIAKWIAGWKKGSALVVTGPTGTGKSTAVRLVAKQLSFEVIESHGDDQRNKEEMEKLLSMTKQQGIFSRKKLLLIEDMDVLESKRTLAKLIEESGCPVVFTTNSYTALANADVVKFQKVGTEEIRRLLKYVNQQEKLNIDDATLDKLARSSEGDVRAGLLDLISGNFSDRSRTSTIYEIMKAVFTKQENAKKMTEGETIDSLILWMENNILTEHKDIESITKAYEALARADLMRARIIKRQSWSLQKYAFDELVHGMPRKKRATLGYYQPPVRRKKNELIEELAKELHMSKRETAKQLLLISPLIK